MKANTLHKFGLGTIVPNAGAPAHMPLTATHQVSLPMAVASPQRATADRRN